MQNKIFTIRIILMVIVCLPFMYLNGQNLTEYKWKNRILVVKSINIASKKQQEQLKEFSESVVELANRKFILFTITGDDFILTDYNNGVLGSGKVSRKVEENILNDNENFEVLVIGLDGGIKLQQTEILTKDNLFQIVDSMPMRREELRKNRKKN